MPSWWTVIEGSGHQDCPQALVKKVHALSWITQAAWKREPNGFHLALACVFEIAEAVKAKKVTFKLASKHHTMWHLGQQARYQTLSMSL